MKYCLRLCLFVIFLAMSTGAAGQELFITLSGKVTDAQTRQFVPYASIRLKSAGTGTMSNIQGDFIFKIPAELLYDTLLISCIGYKTLEQPIPSSDIGDMNLLLEPAVVMLPEVSVTPGNAWDILKEAIAKIPENYDTADVRLTAFYREDIRLAGDTLNFNESVLDIYKTFHTDKDHNDQVRIIKGRKTEVDHSSDPRFYDWISSIKNTAYSALKEDLLKYTGAKNSQLNPKNFRYYTCEYRESIREDNRNLLVLSISPKQRTKKGLFRAKIYIDESSMAILRYEYELTPAGITYANRHGKGGIGYWIGSKIIKATLDFTQIRGVVTYRYYQGKTYLSNVVRHWEFLVNSRKRGIKDMRWTGDFDLLVTDVDTDSVKRFTAYIGDNTSMNHLTGNDYDAEFWENYNILQPVLPDSLKHQVPETSLPEPHGRTGTRVSNRQNGFTRADTLRGRLSSFRSCYDVTFYHLDADVSLDTRSIKGSNKIRFKVTAPFKTMQVDLYANMKIKKILYQGRSLSYTREFDAVFIQFPEAPPAGSEQEITVYYEGVPQVPNWNIPMNGGVLWDKDDLGNPWAQVVCQGSGASLWWPNKDHLSDEPDSMRIWITVPNGFTEVSNGRLQGKTAVGDSKTRYEWFVSYPINNYNVTFSIGKYAHYTDLYIDSRDTLTIDYYVMPYNLERAKTMFRQVKPMLACYEQHFGKYPFPRDGFTLVESPYPMEHQSGVCIGRIKPDTRTDYTPVLWHESAHEWWGNTISCRDLADMWIHEAFATYSEALLMECKEGKEIALKYLNEQKEQVGNREPVVGVYDVNHIYYDIGDMYSKGSLMLNTFRHVLDNDTLWFNLLKDIQQRFRYQTLSSDELVRYICQRTNKDYIWFFDQYLKYPGLPRLEIALKEQGSNLVAKYRWQADVPDFNMPVKVTTAADHFDFIYPDSEWKTITLRNMRAGNFEVDEDHFYFEVVETE